MLTLFVLPSGNHDVGAVNIDSTVASYLKVAKRVVIYAKFKDFDQINQEIKYTDWFGVIYDDEYIEETLRVSLPIFMEKCSADVLVMYKTDNNEKVYKSPRLFRNHVVLQHGTLMPVDTSLKFETILNGFLKSHDPDKNKSSTKN